MSHIIKPIDKKLYVVTAISNTVRYRSRYKLYLDFCREVKDAGAELYTVEAAYGERPFEITDSCNPKHIQLRTEHELWHKENMLNIGISRLPSDWQYVAWIDADVDFARPDWAQETIQQLQHYHVVQMFTEAVDLGPKYEFIHKHKGFVWSYYNAFTNNKMYSAHHPGFAWAARRSFIDIVGGLIDYSILGSADRNMAGAMIGKVEDTYNNLVNKEYAEKLRIWQNRALKIQKNIGYVDGVLTHRWHGAKKNRFYQDRWKILVENDYNPNLDIKRDWQGLWQLTDRNYKLRDDIRTYFRARNEDSIDL